MLCVCVVRVCGLVACVCIRVYVRAYMLAHTDECALLAYISPAPYIVCVCYCMYCMLTPRHALAYLLFLGRRRQRREEEGGDGEKILKMEISKLKSKEIQDKAMLRWYLVFIG